ncbi:MAG TPA: hypothetical protein VJS92_06110 [Candidatus Polarisedimenticolaceae bacterium]|nr:hypothetical protein [Candidatus Polarisedimenticolaceae bacterium]
MGRRRTRAALLCAVLAAAPARAIETDQYYSWGRPLADSTEVLNAKVNAEILLALAAVNRRGDWNETSCDEVRRSLLPHFLFFMYHDLELWADHSSLVPRIPADAEETRDYRANYLYHAHGPLDLGTSLPPSPTVRVHGVRIGTDKLSHFFSEGWWYFISYRKALRRGASPEEATLRAIDKGLWVERTALGLFVSGVLSLADLEANEQGLDFFRGLCEGPEPMLRREAAGWRLATPFDWRRYVTPAWDESYRPSLFLKSRWKKVRPVLERYCAKLSDPEVVREREEYARRPTSSLTAEQVRRRVAAGQLPDPQQFSIERVCAEKAQH